jgi:GntR family transcriptional repressor for pyruvate dehydrogenase complex
MDVTPDGLVRYFGRVLPELDERQRRVLCGATAGLLGRGGVTAVSRAARVSRKTVIAGAREAEQDAAGDGRVRRPGAGRKSAADRDPRMAEALEELLARDQPATSSPLAWTLSSTYELAAELRARGFAVGPGAVGQMLQRMGYCATGRAKSRAAGKRAVIRDQLRCASDVAAAHLAQGQPVIVAKISKWMRPADHVVGDGVAGTYASPRDDASAVEFTVEAIQRWWAEASPRRYQTAARLLICISRSDVGEDLAGAWKYRITRFADATGVEVSLWQIPQGTLKWRGVEPRQFSYQVALARPGQPVACYEASIDLVGAAEAGAGHCPPGAGERQPAFPAPRSDAGNGLANWLHPVGCDCGYTVRPRPGSPAPQRRAVSRPSPGHDPAPDLTPVPAPAAIRSGTARTARRPAGPKPADLGVQPRRRKPKVAEVVAHDIAREISTRRLRPGAKLPSETVALTRFNVSRSSFREALRMLELLGVITIKTGAGGGPVVGQVTSADFGSATTFYYHLVGVTIRELLEARCILEPVLVRLVADQHGEPAVAELRRYMNISGGDESARPAWLVPRQRSRTTGFHRALIGTGNAVLDLISHSIQDVWTARQFMEPWPWEASHHDRDHRQVAQAVLAGDGATAEALMRGHMDYLYDFATTYFADLMDEIIDWH